MPSGREVSFETNEIIVSKTDVKGKIRYANRVFLKISGYREDELIGQPHNIIRHPEMPRGVFYLLWQHLQQGREVFAPVLNLTKTGDYYWVHAHITPTYNEVEQICGYHSNRRVLSAKLRERIWPTFQAMCRIEAKETNPKEAAKASAQFLLDSIARTGMDYDEYIFSLMESA